MKNYNSYSNFPLKPHQSEAVDFLLSHPYAILADEQGLGKTLETLIVAFKSIREDERKVLVICPAFLRLNWYHEIDKMGRYYCDVKLIKDTPTAKERVDDDTDIVIASYSQLEHIEHIFEWADIVIADESHYLKNLGAQRTLKFHKYVYENAPKRVILASGTPIENGAIEFYSPMRLMSYDPKLEGNTSFLRQFPTQEDFNRTFAWPRHIKIKTSRGTTFDRLIYEGVRNLPQLKSLLRDCYLRRTAEEVLDLPPILTQEVFVSYKSDPKLEEEFRKYREGHKSDPKQKAKSAKLKAKFTVDYVKNLNNQGMGPIIIYTDHRDSAHIIAEKLKVPYIDGSISHEKRADMVRDFQNGKLLFFVSTIGAGAEGITITRGSHMVMNDLSWVPAKNSQVYKRFHRIGQEKTCHLHFILGSPQDNKIVQTLNKKSAVLEAIL